MGTRDVSATAAAHSAAAKGNYEPRWTAPNGIAAQLVLSFIFHVPPPASQMPLIAVLVLGGVPLVIPLIRKAFAREFGSDHLAEISIIPNPPRRMRNLIVLNEMPAPFRYASHRFNTAVTKPPAELLA